VQVGRNGTVGRVVHADDLPHLPHVGPVEAGPFDPVSSWIQHEYATEALRATVDLLARHGIEALPVKGVVLARSLYADLAERPMVDIDLRVRPRDFRRLVRVLREGGYELDWSSTHVGAVRMRRRGILIEFESAVGPPGACGLTVDAMLSRARWHEEAGGLRFREPEIHDHAILLCLNVFKDFLRTRPWALEDLRRIVRAPGFHDPTFLARCGSSGVITAAFAVASFLARRGDSRWTELAGALSASHPRRAYLALYRWMCDRPPMPKTEILLAQASADATGRQIVGIALSLFGMGAWKIRHMARPSS
jgi:hypothetical protein